MKHILYLIIFISVVGCYAPTQVYRLEPSEDQNTFVEQGQPFSYKNINDIVVSIGFDTYMDNEYIFDVTIDNKSDSTFLFDPSQAYLFRFANDSSLAEQKIYFAVNPETAIDSIKKTVALEQKKVKRNAIVSVILAAAYITTEVVAANNDVSYETMDAVRSAHDLSQMVLNESRNESIDHIHYLYFTDDYWHFEALRNTEVKADTFYTGKMHFKVPYSPVFKLYIPVNSNTYRFSFDGNSEIR